MKLPSPLSSSPTLARGLLVAGTTSDAGKSVLTTGICRWLHRKGVSVAPYKAQNMSNNSVVALAADRAGEIGRAQALQAAACGLVPDVRFNPILLKPGSDHSSQLIALGQVVGELTGNRFLDRRKELRHLAFEALRSLRTQYDVIICEGAGSPAEINFRAADFVNMGLARHANFPTLVVADIDRGGAFASLFGTLAILEPEDQTLIAGFVLNKFRGSRELLAPAIDSLTALTNRPMMGVLPWDLDVWLDAEDSMAYGTPLGRPGPPHGMHWLRVAALRFPHISNATDLEALACEPGVNVTFTIEPGQIEQCDLLILPGSQATIADLNWLRETGLDRAIERHVAAGRPILGLGSGYQMLGHQISDQGIEWDGAVPGLGFLPVNTEFHATKQVGTVEGTALGAPVSGYEIHHGTAHHTDPQLEGLITLAEGTTEGAFVRNSQRGTIWGTHWHGLFENDEFRRRFLTHAATDAGRSGFKVAPATSYAAARELMINRLADLVEEYLDTKALWSLIAEDPAPRKILSMNLT